MSKIGVGVGEDFPVDENQAPEDEGGAPRHCGSAAYRARRQAWRQFRRQMHEEWHAKRRAMREAMGPEARQAMREHHLHHLVIGGLAVVGLAAVLGLLHRRD